MLSTTGVVALTVATLVGFTAVGIWHTHGQSQTVEDLVTARNSTGRGRLSATLIASVMGVWILFSAPEAGASFGIAAVVGYGIGEAAPMLAYSKIGPRLRAVVPNGHSLTEYAHARYGDAMYAFVLLVSMLYMFIFLAAELTGIASALALVADVPQSQSAILVGGFVLLYTGYGGLRASIFTDTLQALLVLPLLVVALAGAVITLGGAGAIHADVLATAPSLLDPGFGAGLQFGLALAFAILGAELINQTWWQRIYAGKDDETVERSFETATLANGAIVFLAALFGIVAVGQADIVTDTASAGYNADVAFFVLLEAAFPDAVVIGVVLVALLLVISSVDTLFNALSSVVTVDLPRLLADPDDRTLRLGSRALTGVVAVAAIYVSLRAQSVLRLFFFADLLGAAVAFPLVYGLYSRWLTGVGALGSSVVGLAVGLAFFPDFRGVITGIPIVGGALPASDPLYLTSFGGAFLVSTGVALLAARLSSTEHDLDDLSREVGRLAETAPDGGTTGCGARSHSVGDADADREEVSE